MKPAARLRHTQIAGLLEVRQCLVRIPIDAVTDLIHISEIRTRSRDATRAGFSENGGGHRFVQGRS